MSHPAEDIERINHPVRNCPYCGAPQFWSTFSSAFSHAHTLQPWCDEEIREIQ